MPKTWRIVRQGSDRFSWVAYQDETKDHEVARSGGGFKSRKEARKDIKWLKDDEPGEKVVDDD